MCVSLLVFVAKCPVHLLGILFTVHPGIVHPYRNFRFPSLAPAVGRPWVTRPSGSIHPSLYARFVPAPKQFAHPSTRGTFDPMRFFMAFICVAFSMYH
ncbi:hypothetical protein TNCV_1138691 [Trichonephila clavipes]|nr:hypothetical protein TNCV_1138691 [Trichonephila clavipes]